MQTNGPEPAELVVTGPDPCHQGDPNLVLMTLFPPHGKSRNGLAVKYGGSRRQDGTSLPIAPIASFRGAGEGPALREVLRGV